MSRRVMMVAGLLTLVVVSGCQGTGSAGFLSRYDGFEEVHPDVWSAREEVEDAPQRILVPRPMILLKPGSYDSSSIDELGTYLFEELGRRLESVGYTLAEEAGPDTLRLRWGLSDASTSKAIIDVIPSQAKDGRPSLGAVLEAECLDGDTGDRLGAVLLRGGGEKWTKPGFTSVEETRPVADEWIDALVKEIARLSQGA